MDSCHKFYIYKIAVFFYKLYYLICENYIMKQNIDIYNDAQTIYLVWQWQISYLLLIAWICAVLITSWTIKTLSKAPIVELSPTKRTSFSKNLTSSSFNFMTLICSMSTVTGWKNQSNNLSCGRFMWVTSIPLLNNNPPDPHLIELRRVCRKAYEGRPTPTISWLAPLVCSQSLRWNIVIIFVSTSSLPLISQDFIISPHICCINVQFSSMKVKEKRS